MHIWYFNHEDITCLLMAAMLVSALYVSECTFADHVYILIMQFCDSLIRHPITSPMSLFEDLDYWMCPHVKCDYYLEQN